jgi:hypothetical protein
VILRYKPVYPQRAEHPIHGHDKEASMKRRPALRYVAAALVAAAASAAISACASLARPASVARIEAASAEVETGGRTALSLRLAMPGGAPAIEWSASAGSILPTAVDNEVDFIAPSEPGEVVVRARSSAGGRTLEAEFAIAVKPAGALKKTAEVIVEVDCGTLRGVWVDAGHPSEAFAPPLKIKGTFALDADTGEATAGGSWPVYDMYDDGTRGDRAAGDGVWTERFVFRKTSSKVYFAFDDAGAYRVGFESGLAWRLKLAWRGVDEAGAGEVSDANNLFFVPDHDQVVAWTAGMAARSGMYAEAEK